MKILLVLPCLLVLAYANPINNNDLNLGEDVLHKDLNREKRHFGHAQVAVAPVAVVPVVTHHVPAIHHVQPVAQISHYHQQPILVKKPFFRDAAQEEAQENAQHEKEVFEKDAKSSDQPGFKENLKKTIEAVDSMKRELVDIEQNRAALMKEFDTNSELHESLQKARETLEQVGKNFDIEKDSPKQLIHKDLSHQEQTAQLKMTAEQRSSQWKKPSNLQHKESKSANNDEQPKKTEEHKMRATDAETNSQSEKEMAKKEMETSASSPKEAATLMHPEFSHEHARNEENMWHNNKHNADMKAVEESNGKLSISLINSKPVVENNKKISHHDGRANLENMKSSSDLSSAGSHMTPSKSSLTNEKDVQPKSAVVGENEFSFRSNSENPSNTGMQQNNHLQVPPHHQFPEPRPMMPKNASPMPQETKSSMQHVQPSMNQHVHLISSHAKSADMDTMLQGVPMNMAIGEERYANEMMQWKKNHHQTDARSSYGAGATYGAVAGAYGAEAQPAGAVGYFPNANVHGCSLPLLVSCSPSVISGHLSRPYQAPAYASSGYSSPAYRSEDNMRDSKKMELSGLQASKIKRTPSQEKKNKKH